MSWQAHQPLNEEERRHDRSWNDPPLFTDDQLTKANPKVPIHKKYGRVVAPEIAHGGGGFGQQPNYNNPIGGQQPGFVQPNQWNQQQQPVGGFQPPQAGFNSGVVGGGFQNPVVSSSNYSRQPNYPGGFPTPPTPTSPTGTMWPQSSFNQMGFNYPSGGPANSFVSQPPAPVPAFPVAPAAPSIPPPPSSSAGPTVGLNPAHAGPMAQNPVPGQMPQITGHVQQVSPPVQQSINQPPASNQYYGQQPGQPVAYGQPWDQQQQRQQY